MSDRGLARRNVRRARDALCRAPVTIRAILLGEVPSRTRDCEPFLVEQPLDLENSFDIFATIQAMTARAFHRLQHGKFRFPVAQHESLCRRQPADFADAEETLLRNFMSCLRRACHGFSVS